MASFLRRTARLIALIATTAVLYVAHRVAVPYRKRIVRLWMSAMSRILGVRAGITGPRPAGAFLLACNHLGYLDVLVIGSAIEVVFVAKSDVRSWPVIGHLAATAGTIFIDRQSPRDAMRVSQQVGDAVRGGAAVALFPEGTSTDGTSVLPFKPALLDAAARARMPVHHATLRYDRDEAKWYGDATFGPHLWRLLATPRVDAQLRFGAPIEADDRRELARRLQEGVRHVLYDADSAKWVE